jgi:predicted RNA-binding protein YlqC (UPF0109 family)
MEEFLEFIARHLVAEPGAVKLECEEKEEKMIFTLHVADADVGKIIGRKGRTAQALRVLLTAVAARQGKRVILEIAE